MRIIIIFMLFYVFYVVKILSERTGPVDALHRNQSIKEIWDRCTILHLNNTI